MSVLVFTVSTEEGVPPQQAYQCYLTGTDGIPWETTARLDGNRLTVSRQTHESSRLVIPWQIRNVGLRAISTTTLIPRATPYQLVVELARGEMCRVERFLYGWQQRGFVPDAALRAAISAARDQFIRAVLNQGEPTAAEELAEACLTGCFECIDRLIKSTIDFGRHVLETPSSPGHWGVRVSDATQLRRLASLAPKLPRLTFLSFPWSEVEPNPGQFEWHTVRQLLATTAAAKSRAAWGPLLRLSRKDLPDWLYLWSDDFDAIQSHTSQYVTAVAKQLKGHVHLWHCTADTNCSDDLGLTEEDRLRLTVLAVETLRACDAQTPIFCSVRQPWGEYLARSNMDLSPWQYADILVRGDLGLSGLGLELKLSCESGRSWPRDLIAVSELIDEWSQFGLPLLVFLSAPTGPGEDDRQENVTYLNELIQLLLSRSTVHGIAWSSLQDERRWQGGLFDASGNPKPIWHRWQTWTAT